MKDKLEYSSSLEPMHLISDTRSAIILARGTSKENAKKLIHRYNSHDALVEALEMANGMINHIDCPQCDGSGAYYGHDGDACQCQWCHHQGAIKAVLASIKEAK